MKLLKLTSLLLSILLITNCKSKVILEKSSQCSNLKNFSAEEVTTVDELLKSKLQTSMYKLKDKGTLLEVTSRSKKVKDAAFFEAFVNKPDLLFRKITIDKKPTDNKILQALKKIERFKPTDPKETVYYKSNIVGYAENDNDRMEVDRQLALQHYSLSEAGLYWLTNARYINKNKPNRHYLLATDDGDEIKMDNITDFTEDIKDYFEADTFEPGIKLFLNECWLAEYSHLFKREIKDLNIYAVIMDNKIHSIRRIRVRNNNEISIFGVKTIEDAKALVEALENKNLSVNIK